MLFRKTIHYLPAQVLGPLFQLIAMVVWTHFLAPAELGLLALIVAAQELIYSGTLFWFSLYTVRHHDVLADAASRKTFLDSELGVMIAASVAACLMVFLLPLFIGDGWSWVLLAATLLYTVSRGMVAHICDRARAEHDTLTYSLMQICWPVLGLAAALVFVLTIGPTATAVLAGYAVAQVLSLAIGAFRLEFGSRPGNVAQSILQGAMRYGVPLVIGSLLVWVANNSIRFVVEWREGAAAVGLLTVGWGLGLRVSAFASMLVMAAAFPVAVKRSRESGLGEGQLQLERNGVLLLAVMGPACVGLWAVAEPCVRLLIAEPFQDMTIAVLPFAILAGGLRSFRLHFAEQVFLLRERTMVTLWNDLFDAVAATLGTVIGLFYAGLEGAVAGGALGAAASTLVTLIWGWRAHNFALPMADFCRISIATGLMAAAVFLISPTNSVASLSLAVCAGALVYAIALVVFYPDLWRRGLGVLKKETGDEAELKNIVEPEA